MNLTPQEKINIFKNVFRGREDVFAVHWEKADKSASGYTPACLNEWEPGLCYKLQRQKCKDCPHANYVGLNDYYIEQHLRGNKIYGIYPLLGDNYSYFIAADFDGKNWEKDILRFYNKCQEYNLPIYIERSKSGIGGHAWIFFADKYPAFKSRNIIINILREAKIIDQFAKEDSFDRLFPNQDEHSGKGFGNLIALPMQGKARENNNTIFLNPKNNLLPVDDQWELLINVQKISIARLGKLYNEFNGIASSEDKKINGRSNFLKQPTLILVHKKQIYSQWLQRIESFMNIPKRKIGQICANKKTVGDQITVAMLQTLSNADNFAELGFNNIGLVLVDECHHIPAKTFRKVVTKLNPFYLYGFTATPKRKNNDEKLIYIYLGKILHTVSKNFINQTENGESKSEKNTETKVIIKNTEIDVPFKVKIDNFQILSKIITFDSNRNKLIIDDVIKEASDGNKCLILTERKEHVETLSYYLKGNYEIITLTGELTEKQKNEKLQQIEVGNFQIIIATGQLIGEGTDFPNLNRLFLVYPFSFEGKLVQYIGRIQRGQNLNSTIYDYRDVKINYLEKFYKKREKFYKKHFSL